MAPTGGFEPPRRLLDLAVFKTAPFSRLGKWAYGDSREVRTLDPLIKSQVLYRLSYGTIYNLLAGAVGFEPTPRALETRLYGFEDRCATITLSPY